MDRMKRYTPSEKNFSILTNKSLNPTKGDIVWLVVGEGKPRRYSLGSRFVVEGRHTGGGGRFKYEIFGLKGRDFVPLSLIDTLPWFQELFTKTAHFSTCLQVIRSANIINGLESVHLSSPS
jgi:hypothetical protein